MSKIILQKIFFACTLLFNSQIIATTSIKQIEFTSQEKDYLDTKKEIKMCVDPNWFPFEAIDKNNKHIGISAELIKLISERTGLKIKLIKTKTWDETIILSKTKKCDIISFINQTPQRDEWLIFSEPILQDPNIIITREEHPFVSDLKSLDKQTIAIPNGTSMMEKIKRDFPNLRIIPVETETDAMQIVSNKTADMTIRSLIMSAYTIKKDGLFNLKISGQPQGYENNFRIGIAKNERILQSIINKGIETINPIEKEVIVNRYTGITYHKGIDSKVLGFILISVLFIVSLVLAWNYSLRKRVSMEIAKNNKIKEQLYIKTKQIELGNLVGNIAHQWLGPLSKLSTINLLLMTKLEANEVITNDYLNEKAKEIEKTIDFMSQTVKKFLGFYKQNNYKNDFSMKDSISDAFFIVEDKLIDLNVKTKITGDIVFQNGIKNEWTQIWLNLIHNSVNAFIKNNTINPKISMSISADKIKVCDNAGGMDLNLIHHGLGHKICQDIANKYNSQIKFTNTKNGLCVTVLLNNKNASFDKQ